MSGMIDWDNISRSNFRFDGNYRAIVEDTNDPLNAGRVRVRIFGIHSPDPTVTPTEQLLWAEPALGLYHGGGILNDKNINDEADLDGRYTPKKDIVADIPSRNVTQLTPSDGKWEDAVMNACGAGGIYTVPRLGSIVWIFFDSGNHLYPKYWATAPRKEDWVQQRNKIDELIAEKRDQIAKLKDAITTDTTEYKGSGEATKNAKVATKIPTPKMWIHQLSDITNAEITSVTSAFGATYIIVNKNGKERLYVFNKGTAQYTDEQGQSKTLIGISNNSGSDQNNDYQMMVGNNVEIHLLGDYNLFAKNNIFLETEGNVEINSKTNVGIVAREGDIDIIVKKGHCNIDVEGNCNIRSGGNTQVETEGDMIAKVRGKLDAAVQGDVVANVQGDVDIKSQGDINLSTDSGINLNAQGDIAMSCTNLKVQANSSVSVQATSTVDVQGTSGVNVQGGSSGLSLAPGTANLQSSQIGLSGTSVQLQGQVNMGSSANGGTANPPTTQTVTPAQIPPAENFQASGTDKTIEETAQQVSDADN
jgi:hypothetical protein